MAASSISHPHSTHHAQLSCSLPDFPLHLMQLQAQLFTWDHSRPLRRWWWGLWLACQGGHLPLQQQPVTSSLNAQSQAHTHLSIQYTPCRIRPKFRSITWFPKSTFLISTEHDSQECFTNRWKYLISKTLLWEERDSRSPNDSFTYLWIWGPPTHPICINNA